MQRARKMPYHRLCMCGVPEWPRPTSQRSVPATGAAKVYSNQKQPEDHRRMTKRHAAFELRHSTMKKSEQRRRKQPHRKEWNQEREHAHPPTLTQWTTNRKPHFQQQPKPHPQNQEQSPSTHPTPTLQQEELNRKDP
ncbi:hypothetical protein MTO96_000508 [Rhipicephalus appendiculatus]